MNYVKGDKVYIIENKYKVTMATVVECSENAYTLFISEGADFRLPPTRVFPTEDAAHDFLYRQSKSSTRKIHYSSFKQC